MEQKEQKHISIVIPETIAELKLSENKLEFTTATEEHRLEDPKFVDAIMLELEKRISVALDQTKFNITDVDNLIFIVFREVGKYVDENPQFKSQYIMLMATNMFMMAKAVMKAKSTELPPMPPYTAQSAIDAKLVMVGGDIVIKNYQRAKDDYYKWLKTVEECSGPIPPRS